MSLTKSLVKEGCIAPTCPDGSYSAPVSKRTLPVVQQVGSCYSMLENLTYGERLLSFTCWFTLTFRHVQRLRPLMLAFGELLTLNPKP